MGAVPSPPVDPTPSHASAASAASAGRPQVPVRTRRIVVGADLSPAGNAALLWAIRQARRRDSHVMVLDSRTTSAVDVGEETAEALRKEHRWQLQAWVSEVLMSVSTRVPVLVSTTEGRLELALAGAGSRADLVVYGEDERGGPRLDAAVLRRFCPCPVVRINRHQVPTWLGERA